MVCFEVHFGNISNVCEALKYSLGMLVRFVKLEIVQDTAQSRDRNLEIAISRLLMQNLRTS